MRETGVGIYEPLFFIGVVENNVDERLEGRVQVRAFGVHGTNQQVPTESLPWATLIHGSYDPNAPLPPVNSFVFGFFIDGRDAQQPMILGLIPTQMTEILDPEVSGWGRIVDRGSHALSRGSNATDLGEPANSRLVRGESIDGTYVTQQAMSRSSDIPIAGANPDDPDSRRYFAEPAPAYNSEYPYNRVIQTANHSIELDDTPGSERITVYHSSGSYIAIDSRGTSVYKSVSDSYNINDRHHNVYIKGDYNITVDGDCRFLVQGNKIEEITGDLIQNVRGNHFLSVGGQSTINASEEVQIRGAKLRLHANVEGINLNSAKKIRLFGGESIGIKSAIGIQMDAEGAIDINAKDGNLNMQSSDEVNIKSATMYLNAEGALDLKGGHVKLGGGTKVSIDAGVVAIDDIIQLANGQAMAPEGAGDAGEAETAETVEAPEPVGKGVSTTRRQPTGGGSFGHSGYASRDEPEGDGAVSEPSGSAEPYSGQRLTNAQVDQILSGEEPTLARSSAEEFLGRPLSDTEWNNLVAATVAESLPNSPEEQAAIMAVILNRVRSDQYPNTVTDVLLQRNQFQAVTGTRANGNAPSNQFTNPDRGQIASTVNGVNQYLGTMSPDWLNFTSNITAAYGAGTDIGFRDDVRSASNSRIIGGTVFGTV